MRVKILFKKDLSGNYFVDHNQTFTKEQALYIQKAVKEKQEREKEK